MKSVMMKQARISKNLKGQQPSWKVRVPSFSPHSPNRLRTTWKTASRKEMR